MIIMNTPIKCTILYMVKGFIAKVSPCNALNAELLAFEVNSNVAANFINKGHTSIVSFNSFLIDETHNLLTLSNCKIYVHFIGCDPNKFIYLLATKIYIFLKPSKLIINCCVSIFSLPEFEF